MIVCRLISSIVLVFAMTSGVSAQVEVIGAHTRVECQFVDHAQVAQSDLMLPNRVGLQLVPPGTSASAHSGGFAYAGAKLSGGGVAISVDHHGWLDGDWFDAGPIAVMHETVSIDLLVTQQASITGLAYVTANSQYACGTEVSIELWGTTPESLVEGLPPEANGRFRLSRVFGEYESYMHTVAIGQGLCVSLRPGAYRAAISAVTRMSNTDGWSQGGGDASLSIEWQPMRFVPPQLLYEVCNGQDTQMQLPDTSRVNCDVIWEVEDSRAADGWADVDNGMRLGNGVYVECGPGWGPNPAVYIYDQQERDGIEVKLRARVFTTCGEQTVSEPIVFVVHSCCTADFNHSTAVDADDLFAFLDQWFREFSSGGGPERLTDFDGSSVVNVDDVFAFLDAWFVQNGGC